MPRDDIFRVLKMFDEAQGKHHVVCPVCLELEEVSLYRLDGICRNAVVTLHPVDDLPVDIKIKQCDVRAYVFVEIAGIEPRETSDFDEAVAFFGENVVLVNRFLRDGRELVVLPIRFP